MRKFVTACGAAMCFSGATAAIAMTGNDHSNTLDVFFRCSSISSLWHVIATGNWAFTC